MISRDEIFSVTKNILSQMIRKDPDEIGIDDRLDQDLGVDSMDAVDMVVDLKMELGVKFGSEDVESVRTVRDIVDRIQDKLDDRD